MKFSGHIDSTKRFLSLVYVYIFSFFSFEKHYLINFYFYLLFFFKIFKYNIIKLMIYRSQSVFITSSVYNIFKFILFFSHSFTILYICSIWNCKPTMTDYSFFLKALLLLTLHGPYIYMCVYISSSSLSLWPYYNYGVIIFYLLPTLTYFFTILSKK